MSRRPPAEPSTPGALSRAFARDEGGNVAVIFAVCIVAIIMVILLAIDLTNIQRARSKIQDGLDASVLALATSQITDDKAADKSGGEYLAANLGKPAGIRIKLSDFTIGDTNVTGVAEAEIDTLFVNFMKRSPVLIRLRSVVDRSAGGDLELALVLDTTGSMSGTKLTTLKTASQDLAKRLTQSGKGHVKIAVVPFANYVNVGVSRRNQPWISVPADWTETKPAGACYEVKDKDECVKTKTYACTKYNDGVPYQSTCTDYSCKKVPVTPYTVCPKPTDIPHKFNGCVGSPPYPKNVSDSDSYRIYPGMMDKTCASEITPLTSNAATLDKAIVALKAVGETYIPSGLAWGFNMLSAPVPMTEAAAYDKTGENKKPRKVMILMTDGANTKLMRASGDHEGSPATGKPATQANTYTAELCTNIKAKKIEVYSVAFEVTDVNAKKLLEDCATNSLHYYDAKDSAALSAAFQHIAEALAPIHITH